MFLYPALTIGFLFVAVPLLVHLINMLRHRRQKWAAMDFLMASYRKQRRWIILRQLLLLLSRLALAALLIAMLCGWTGGKQMLGALGGKTTHHVFVLDDSYSMGDASGGSTAYDRAIQALETLTEQLASEEGNTLTVMRASRAAIAVQGGSDRGDAATDVSVQSVMSDNRLISRVVATRPAPIRTDLIPALDLVQGIVASAVADETVIYVASDFRQHEWDATDRIAESMRQLDSPETQFRLIDCAESPSVNLSVQRLRPMPDVWVAGVPVTMQVEIKNHSKTPVTNVALKCQVIQYDDSVDMIDETLRYSGTPTPLPAMVIASIPAGETVTRQFQVYIATPGTHVVEATLPDDAIAVDNRRACTLPLTGTERVLIVDGSLNGRGAYHVSSVLDPGSQVRIGATPEIQPVSFLRSVTFETLTAYRAVYLIDVPEIGENTADALHRYVTAGGGLAWFLGENVNADSYNGTLLSDQRTLLPAPLTQIQPLKASIDGVSGDVVPADETQLLAPLRSGGDSIFSLIGVAKAWSIKKNSGRTRDRIDDVLQLRDGRPLVTQHRSGAGQIVTVLTGLERQWTNWPRDPTFVVFVLQTNASLWSGASPPTSRLNISPIDTAVAATDFAPLLKYAPSVETAPRVGIELNAERATVGDTMLRVNIDPKELALAGDENYADLIMPGINESELIRLDGPSVVVPSATVMETGEGDLTRANRVTIGRNLESLDVKFVSSGQWSDQSRTSGGSVFLLVLLGLFVLFFAIEQALAYWASYHTSTKSSKTGDESRHRHYDRNPPVRGHRRGSRSDDAETRDSTPATTAEVTQ